MQDKAKVVRPDDVVRAWAGVLASLKSLSEAAHKLGGKQGELLLEETAAQVRRCVRLLSLLLGVLERLER